MFKFRVFFATCLFFAALFSVQSHAMGVKHELNSNQSSYSDVINVDHLTNTPTPTKSLGNLKHKNSKHSDFAAHQPRLTANNSFLFLHSAQGDPEYDVVHEFFALNGPKGNCNFSVRTFSLFGSISLVNGASTISN